MINEMTKKIDQNLEWFGMRYPDSELKDIVMYSLEGGKRLRPLIFMMFMKAFGLNNDLYMDLAVAIELIHNYTLIHDDLPAMDNDKYRRGKESV
jgi:geranylgeranyl diphosphate synthase type II